MKRLPLILTVIFLVCGCNDDRLSSAFSARDDIRLQIGGVEQLCYDPLTWQMGFNQEKRQFRVHTDNMSDFFTLTLSRIPEKDGETITGNLVYTTHDNVVTKNNITLEVIRLEGDRIWLWNHPGRIGLEVQILD